MHWLLSALLVLAVRLNSGPWLQAPGFADITRPVSGESVRGVVTLEGTANHPSFDHFDLAFGYDPDPTDTWFPIVDSDRSRVVEGRLAVWDTSAVADGEYLISALYPGYGVQTVTRTVAGVPITVDFSLADITAPRFVSSSGQPADSQTTGQRPLIGAVF